MITKQKLITAFGGTFTTRKKVAEALGYKDPHRVDKYLRGLDRINNSRYLSSDVADAILSQGLH